MEQWLLLVEEAHSPYYNMACDQWLLHHIADFGKPILRLYQWDRPSISIGYFQTHCGKDPSKCIVRRPTGGGAVDHTIDCTYSVVLPRSHPWCDLCPCDRYQAIHKLVKNLLLQRSLETSFAHNKPNPIARSNSDCFAEPTRYDVLLEGEKVGGAAQRLTKEGLLHQGSVLVRDGQPWKVEEWKQALLMNDIELTPMTLSSEMKCKIEELAIEKYADKSWNEKR